MDEKVIFAELRGDNDMIHKHLLSRGLRTMSLCLLEEYVSLKGFIHYNFLDGTIIISNRVM